MSSKEIADKIVNKALAKVRDCKPAPIVRNDKDTPQMDWQQVVLNGGPPCFFIEGPQFCGRAERWQGHGNKAFHRFVPLHDLLTTVRKEAREAAFKSLQQQVDDLRAACDCGNLDPRDVDRLIEAAANTKEGAGDADISKS